MCKSKREGGQRCELGHGAKNRARLSREYNSHYLKAVNTLRAENGLESVASIAQARQWAQEIEGGVNLIKDPADQTPENSISEDQALLVRHESEVFMETNVFHSLVTPEEKALLQNVLADSLDSGHPLALNPLSPSLLSEEEFAEIKTDLENSLLEIDDEIFEHSDEIERTLRAWENYTLPPEYASQIEDREDLIKSLREEEAYTENRLAALHQDGNILYGKNGCVKLETEGGTIGYFKDTHSSNKNNLLLVGVSEVGLLRHEVAAFALSRALGEGYQDTVPPTYVRVYRNTQGELRLGSIQEHRDGDLGLDAEESGASPLSITGRAKELAVLGFLIGDQDRHGGNLICNSDKGEVYLIDNGYSFPETNLTPHKDSLQNPFAGQEFTLDDRDVAKLSKLVSSPSCLGLDRYLTKKEILELKGRAQAMIERGSALTPADYFEVVPFEQWEQEAYKYRSVKGDRAQD